MTVRPIAIDPAATQVRSMLSIDQTWAIAAPGDYATFAVEAMTNDGGNYQRLVALEFPARLNKTDELVTLRLLIAPEDAAGLAETLAHTYAWLRALAEMES